MSQEELAEILQVSRQSVSKWENGLSNPDTENLIRLAEIFQVDVNLLIGSQLEAEEKVVEPTPPPDQRNTVRLLSVLLALAVCVALLFAALWIEERHDGTTGTSTHGGTEMWWDSLQMRTGMLDEVVVLTSEEKRTMAEYISRFHFEEKTEEKQDENYVCGGRIYTVEYTKDGTLFHWYFTESQTYCEVSMPDGQKLSYGYSVDYALLYELDRYVY